MKRERESKHASRKKLFALVTSAVFVFAAVGISVAVAALTFNATSVVSDGVLTLTGAASSTLDLGSGSTLSIQTTNNGPITFGSGLLTINGFVSAVNNILFASGKGIDSSAAGTLLIGNSTTTGITIGRSGQTVTFPGNLSITGPTLFSAGAALDSSAAGTLLIGNTTTTGITIGRSGQVVSFPGNVSSTGTLTVGSSTVNGSLQINSGATVLKHLSATSSITFGVIASSSCATATMTVTGANAGDNVYAAPTPVASGIETVSAVWSAYASSTNLVAIKACNPTITNTASVAAEVWRADVWQH